MALPAQCFPAQCFANDLSEPWKIFEVPRSPNPDEEGPGLRARQVRDFQALTSYLENDRIEDCQYRFISICQRNSWRPLDATGPMLKLLMDSFELGEPLEELASYFYTKHMDVEETLCMPYTERRSDSVVEASYTIRYPEHRPEAEGPNKWVIRQTGVYYRTNVETSQSLFVMLNPKPNAKANQRAEEWILEHPNDGDFDPMWLHRIVHETYLPAWRSYISHFEEEFLPMALTTFAVFIEEPTTLKPSDLTKLASLENRFLQIPAILSSTGDVVKELSIQYSTAWAGKKIRDPAAAASEFDNFRRRCGAFSRTATYLHQRAQNTAQLLANTLSFREQLDTRKQNHNMLKLNKSVVFITTLTLLYLPPSFVATFFGMNFFDLDDANHRIVSTSMIWIYVVSSVVLTAATFIIYPILLEGGPLGKRQIDLPKVGDWSQLKLWVRKRDTFAGNSVSNV